MTNSTTFLACVAGLNIAVTAKHPSVQQSFHYFRTEGKAPDFTISVDDELFAFVKRMHNSVNPTASDARIESIALQYALCREALYYDCLVLHASSLQMNGKAYVFSAPSKTGKSTHSRMWREVFGDRVSMINDDMPLLRRKDGSWFVCGTPWNGKHGLGFNCIVPLKAVTLLSRGDDRIRPFDPQQDLPYLLNQVFRPYEAELLAATLNLLDKLLAEAPLFHLFCTPTHNAAKLAKAYIKEGNIHEN